MTFWHEGLVSPENKLECFLSLATFFILVFLMASEAIMTCQNKLVLKKQGYATLSQVDNLIEYFTIVNFHHSILIPSFCVITPFFLGNLPWNGSKLTHQKVLKHCGNLKYSGNIKYCNYFNIQYSSSILWILNLRKCWLCRILLRYFYNIGPRIILI
jgi:hypothetical protein